MTMHQLLPLAKIYIWPCAKEGLSIDQLPQVLHKCGCANAPAISQDWTQPSVTLTGLIEAAGSLPTCAGSTTHDETFEKQKRRGTI